MVAALPFQLGVSVLLWSTASALAVGSWRTDSDFTGFTVNVLRSFPHQDRPFTQGLEMGRPGVLIETSGSWPPPTTSYIRELSTETGETLRKITSGLEAPRFAEGIVEMADGRWFVSTYDSYEASEYDSSLNFVRYHPYSFMGWGLTRMTDGTGFLATDGSPHIRTLDMNFTEVKSQVVQCQGRAIAGLNELEMVEDFLGRGPAVLGNVINSRVVLVLNPSTMECIGSFHLNGLEPPTADEPRGAHVANGIAFDKNSGSFYFTGKNWENMYEAKVTEETVDSPSPSALEALNMYLDKVQAPSALLLEEWASPAALREVQEHIAAAYAA
mmetsp:Transcript_26208/g.61162  ORF Transcript_26208/g.61162 Transcript_26208/m.61162 type:complete len:328 (-) Transcript_26208:127-1110(-)